MFGIKFREEGLDKRLKLRRHLHCTQHVRVPRRGLHAFDGITSETDNVTLPLGVIDGGARVVGNPIVVLAVHACWAKHCAELNAVCQPCLESERGVFARVGRTIEVEAPVAFSKCVQAIGAPVADLVKHHLGEAIIRIEISAGAELQASAAVGGGKDKRAPTNLEPET